MFFLIFNQTIRLAFRKGGGALGGLAFYLMVFTLFTFAMGPEGIRQYALAVMSVSLLLASVITIPSIFERDDEDGTLEQYLLQPMPLELIILAKWLGLWVSQFLPILLISPLLSLMAGIEPEAISSLLLRLCLFSPSIAAVAVLTAALTLGTRRGGVLPALISLPLTIPLLIFVAGLTGSASLLLLLAFALASVPLACFVSALLIRTLD